MGLTLLAPHSNFSTIFIWYFEYDFLAHFFFVYVICSQLDCIFLEDKKFTNFFIALMISAKCLYLIIFLKLLFSLITKAMMDSDDAYSVSTEINTHTHTVHKHALKYLMFYRSKSRAFSTYSSDTYWLFFRICQETFKTQKLLGWSAKYLTQ